MNNFQFLSIANKQSALELVIIENGTPKTLRFNPHWLRFNCQSPLSRQTSTGQRTIPVDNIPKELLIKQVEKIDDKIHIKWNESAKQIDTIIPIDYLIKNYPSNISSNHNYKPFEKLNFFNYFDFVDQNRNKNNEKIFEWIKHLAEHGLCVVKNLPNQENMIKNLVELIAPLQRTIYDDIFDVKVDKNPVNLAFSEVPLEFHMDLVYYECPPGIQFLHCLKFDSCIVGGETTFIDSFELAEKFRKDHPDLFNVLTKIPASFQKVHNYKDRKVFIFHSRPHIEVNHRNRIIAVNWGPANEGPLKNLSEEEIKLYYEAYLEFSKTINNKSKIISHRLEPGEVVCFNNRRFLHSRNGFKENNGSRHFQGCYLNMDEFKSELIAKEFELKNNNKNENINPTMDLTQLESKDLVVGNTDHN